MDNLNSFKGRRGQPLRLGELLVQSGMLTPIQRDRALEAQQASGRPFGEIVEKLFNVHPEAVEAAWAQQYAAGMARIDPREQATDPEVLTLVGRRQAWQFRVLPLRRDGAEIMVCTTPDDLVRALKFLGWQVRGACYMVLADPEPMYAALATHYPMAGLGPQSVQNGRVRVASRSRPGRSVHATRAKPR